MKSKDLKTSDLWAFPVRGGGFTMAEILLSLTIIGIVAAITLPSLTGNINERTWNTQRKALFARFSQALALMPSLNGYGELTTDKDGNITDTATETFLTEGLSKVLKINNICDSEHLADCGLPSQITTLTGTNTINLEDIKQLNSYNDLFDATHSISQDTKAAAFETQNGESILVYYNPNCQADMNETDHYIQPKMCANFVYDLNGNKGPNTFGKDIGFITALYPTDPNLVAPIPLPTDVSSTQVTYSNAISLCKKQDSESRLPNSDELAAMFYNKILLDISAGQDYWTTSRAVSNGETKAYRINFAEGIRLLSDLSSRRARCIKR